MKSHYENKVSVKEGFSATNIGIKVWKWSAVCYSRYASPGGQRFMGMVPYISILISLPSLFCGWHQYV